MDFDWDTFMSDAWPWIWPSVTLIAWLVLGFYLVRRLLRILLARAEKTVNPYDDELVPTLRRPLQVGVLIAGLALWRTLAPLPPGTSTALGLVTKGAITLVIVLVIDEIVVVVIDGGATVADMRRAVGVQHLGHDQVGILAAGIGNDHHGP